MTPQAVKLLKNCKSLLPTYFGELSVTTRGQPMINYSAIFIIGSRTFLVSTLYVRDANFRFLSRSLRLSWLPFKDHTFCSCKVAVKNKERRVSSNCLLSPCSSYEDCQMLQSFKDQASHKINFTGLTVSVFEQLTVHLAVQIFCKVKQV